MARCNDDGSCKWQAAGEKDKAQKLVIDFAGKRALIVATDRERPYGIVVSDETDGDRRKFVIARQASQDPSRRMRLSLAPNGKLTGTRSGGRVKLEASCTAS